VRATLTLILAAGLAAGSASRGAAQSRPADTGRIADTTNSFGFRLLEELVRTEPGSNVFISSASVGMALAMTLNGAAGTTRTAMAATLGLGELAVGDVNEEHRTLRTMLTGPDPKVRLDIANSIWAHQGVGFVPAFLAVNKEFFGAELKVLDFALPASVGIINAWVAKSTNGRISSIINQLNPDDIMILINAIYFKGTWTEQFDKDLTYEQDFHLAGEKSAPVPMMHQSGRYRYWRGDGMQVAALPYGAGRLSLYLFRPENGRSTAEVVSGLAQGRWPEWKERLAMKKGDVGLPRFKLEYSVSLADALKRLGMAIAFDPGRADFTGLLKGQQRAYIGDVLHKTFLEVNEEGTEAAAVTAVKMLATAMPEPEERFSLVLDRPFVALIADDATGMVLFSGVINDPRN